MNKQGYCVDVKDADFTGSDEVDDYFATEADTTIEFVYDKD